MNVLATPIPCRWLLEESNPFGEAIIELVGQMQGPPLYAVRKRSWCLHRNGTWDYEPQPSSRTDAFLKTHRFATFDQALVAARGAVECP